MKLSLVSLLAACVAGLCAQTPASVFSEAVAVWHMQSANSADGQSPLTISGNVALAQPLHGADAEHSRARGGDAQAARFSGGTLNAGQGADGKFQIKGDQLTLLLRMRPSAWPMANGELFSKHGGHAKTSYNIFTVNGELGFQIGTQRSPGVAIGMRVPADKFKKDQWYDIVARYDGRRCELFVDGVRLNVIAAEGPLRENTLPLLIGGAMRGEIDHAAIWSRALSNDEIVILSGGHAAISEKLSEQKTLIEAQTGKDNLTSADHLKGFRQWSKNLAEDKHRPRYHLSPPDGIWNDINGTMFWKGRYHVMFLGRYAPEAQTALAGEDTPKIRDTWLHASSADLVHWVHHTPALMPQFDGSMPMGIFSGDAVDGAPVPTLIYHVPMQGICLATADNPEDPELVKWTPYAKNPVIPIHGQPPEVKVFDPAAWREADGTYYALIGNKNTTPGHEGDCNSLYRSRDMVNWEYRGPFYKSDRKWTREMADAACPDFFPIGNGKHMLLLHQHRPMFVAAYYIGVWDRQNERFIPEQFAFMNWPGGSVCAPETLLDDKGRRIFWGWVRKSYSTSPSWASVATLPRVLSLAQDNTLRIRPVPELETLRHDERSFENLKFSGERLLENAKGDMLEIRAKIVPGQARRFGVVVRQSPEKQEQLPILIDLDKKIVMTDLSKASLDKSVRYPRAETPAAVNELQPEERFVKSQEAPFELKEGEAVDLRIFVDKSIIEVFVNDRQCLTQRIFPTRDDAQGVSVVSDAPVTFEKLQVWKMHPTQ